MRLHLSSHQLVILCLVLAFDVGGQKAASQLLLLILLHAGCLRGPTRVSEMFAFALLGRASQNAATAAV